jgi:hypothetical protein
MKRTPKTKKSKPKTPNRGLLPSPERVAEMRGKGWDLSQNLAREFGVGQSTIKLWGRNGRIDSKTQTLKAYGNRWYSIKAVAACVPKIPEAR